MGIMNERVMKELVVIEDWCGLRPHPTTSIFKTANQNQGLFECNIIEAIHE